MKDKWTGGRKFINPAFAVRLQRGCIKFWDVCVKNRVILIIILGALLLALPSCQADSGPVPDLVVWTGMGDQELETLREITRQFNEKNGLNVSIVKVPFGELRIKYQIAAPARQGPDLLTGPQDWIGAFATADLIDYLKESDLPDQERQSYNPVALENMTYDGRIYGLPLFMETVAIIYNKDLVKTEPQTMKELVEQAVDFSATGTDKYGFFFEAGNLYFSWPFLSGYGSRIFGTTNGKMDINNILLNSPETARGMSFLADLKRKYNLLPNGATTDMMCGIFYERNMPFCLNGPWMLGELRNRNIPCGVMPIPLLDNGERPRPFVGVQGVILNKLTRNRQLAIKFMHHLNQPENQKSLCLASGRIPSRFDTLKLIGDQEAILKFAKAAEYGTPMPNHPAMSAVWVPMNEALQLVIKGGKEPQEVLADTVRRIKDDIRIMTE